MKKALLLLISTFAVVLASCAHTNANINATCEPGRSPSSAVMCANAVERKQNPSTLDLFKERADKFKSGLQQTTFTNTKGDTLRQGRKEVVPDKNQIVSFYFDRYPDGTLNRGGTMVQGTPTEIIFDSTGSPAYIIFANQPVRLLEFTADTGNGKTSILKGQNYSRHQDGFSSPIGLVKGLTSPLSEIPIADLKPLLQKMTDANSLTTIEFESGVVVSGVLESFTENKSAKFGTATVITFKNGTARVTVGDRVLFDPSWGTYDMILGGAITNTNLDARQLTY